jgi:tagatose 6-phosphate kinase
VADASVVVLSGSLPGGVPEDAYAQLASIAREAGTAAVLDADGPALRAGLRAEPAMAKPNAAELAEATGRLVATVSDARAAAQMLRHGTATAIVASLGAAGLVASTMDGDWHARLDGPVPGNPTGAGDACVAALAAGLFERREWRDVLTDAVAYGAAAVAESRAGVVDPHRIQALRARVVVEEI